MKIKFAWCWPTNWDTPASGESTLSALCTLAQENLASLNPHPLYILIHYSHPPIPERLPAINQVATKLERLPHYIKE